MGRGDDGNVSVVSPSASRGDEEDSAGSTDIREDTGGRGYSKRRHEEPSLVATSPGWGLIESSQIRAVELNRLFCRGRSHGVRINLTPKARVRAKRAHCFDTAGRPDGSVAPSRRGEEVLIVTMTMARRWGRTLSPSVAGIRGVHAGVVGGRQQGAASKPTPVVRLILRSVYRRSRSPQQFRTATADDDHDPPVEPAAPTLSKILVSAHVELERHRIGPEVPSG